MMRSGNPTLNDKIFSSETTSLMSDDAMTIQGTVNKTAILLFLLMITAYYTWNGMMSTFTPDSYGQAVQGEGFSPIWMAVGGIGGFVCAIVLMFKKTWAPILAPAYALLEGLLLGGVSAMYEIKFGGIVFQAVGLTFCILFSLLFLYKTGLIKATENFKLGIAAATGGIFVIYMIGFVMSFFGASIPMIHESGPIGIGFSVIVCAIAALNLVMDFDFIENASESGRTPKYMEWYGAFGLLVTLIWLYLELLRLLSKLQNRD